MNIDTNWLEDFLMLAKVQHFSKAAQLRHITQPAFGRRIRSLESSVGQQLIDRNTTPVSLTPAGKQFLVVARNMVNQMQSAIAQLNADTQSILSPVTIASPHSLASPTLIQLLDSVQETGTTLPYSVDVLRVEEGIHALKEGLCDYLLAFDHIALLQPPFKNLLLGQGQFLLVCAQKNGKPLFSLDESELPYLRYTDNSYSARLLEQHQPEFSTHLNPIFHSSMCQLHKEMVLLGKGVAWLPDVLIGEELQKQEIVALDPELYSLPFKIRLYRYNTSLSMQAQQLWESLQHKYSQRLFCQPFFKENP
ncbi:LysR family transcriptional regulator [Celerinatantimonas sp. MCCC 1A17872]|uniref:LysR family transcriptional regulator n=1 Tax=Celerinatantimonas sp. MCCC 1A17872 TaxID=3177514 RepID=UPI0038C8C95B